MKKITKSWRLLVNLVVVAGAGLAFSACTYFTTVPHSSPTPTPEVLVIENELETEEKTEKQATDSALDVDGSNLNETTITLTATQDGQTAFELLTENAEVEYKEYDFGVFIESINGIKGDDQNYWAFYVNGEYAQSGADQVILQSGDQVKFEYTSVEKAVF